MSTVIIKSNVPRLTKAHKQAISRAVRQTALSIEADAKLRAPVDTGFMRNSIQTQVTGEMSAEVTVGAEYGAFVELGTSRTPAQPFLTPAVDAARQPFEKAIKAALGK
jgi:HK97 gp10 family phage protein